jgi:hypothetical protein
MARISERCNVCGLPKLFNNKWCKAHNNAAAAKATQTGIRLICSVFHFDERTKTNKIADATIVEINGERKGLCKRCHEVYLTLESDVLETEA